MRRYSFIIPLFVFAVVSFAADKVELRFFYSKSCEHCEEVMQEIIRPMADEFSDYFEVTKFEIEDNNENYEKLIELEGIYGDENNEIPVIFVGDSVYGGEEDFVPYLKGLIETARKADSSDVDVIENVVAVVEVEAVEDKVVDQRRDEPDSVENYSVFLAYFWETGCQHCSRVVLDIQLLKERHPTLEVRDWNIDSKAAKQFAEALAIRHGVDELLQLATPSVFFHDTALITDQISFRALDEAITRLEKIPNTDTVWNFTEEELSAADDVIVERFRGLEAAPVILAGLLDGLNPCAFGAIIFFVTFLTVVKRRKREIFWVGVAFTVSVFLTYILIGAGFLRFLQALPFLKTFARWVYIITGVMVVGLGILSIYDFIRGLKGEYGDMLLQLPDKLKKRIHRVIISENEPRTKRNTIVAAATTGFLVSLLELACTGQVYLPTIIYVMGAPGLKAKAYLYLLLYNFMFIVPLIIVFIVVFFGTTSEQLSRFLRKNTPAVKLLTACIFFAMAFFMWRTVLGL